MKQTHTIEQIGDTFFVVLLSLLSHEESIRFTLDMAPYYAVRKYVRLDGNVALVIEPDVGGMDDFRLAEMYCQMNMRQVGIWKCPICRDKGELGDTCGHLVFERFI